MKIGIVGSGLVGSTAAYAMVMSGVGREIVLVDKNTQRAEAEANDIYHAVPFAHPLNIHHGDYADLVNSQVVVIAAGVNQKSDQETRLELLTRNANIFRQIVPSILQYAPEAVLIVATNPVDIMTHLTARFAAEQGLDTQRVLGSGTTLDTARFRALLARHVGVDSHHVHGYVIGEHGDTEVLTWSLATVAGLPLEDFCEKRNIPLDEPIRQQIDHNVRHAAYQIIGGKQATYYGIGSAIARIVDVILHDQRAILTVCSPQAEVAGVHDVTLALPQLLGGSGIMETFSLPLNDEEQAGLHHSASALRRAIEQLDQPQATE